MANQKHDTVGAFPSPLLPKEDKIKPSYGLDYAKAMYYEYNQRDFVLRQKNRSRVQYLRAIAEGSTNPNEYLDLLFDGDTSLYVNLDATVPMVIPKFINIIVNKIIKSDYYINIDAPSSSREKDMYKAFQISKMMLAQDAADIAKKFNLPQPPPPPFSSIKDLEIHMMTDFKLSSEIAAEKGLSVVFDKSRIKEVMKRVVRDITVVGLGATKTEFDENGAIFTRYVDVENFLYSFSNDPDFKRAQHGGEMRPISISDLRMESNLPEDVLFKIAKSVAGKNNNPDKLSNQTFSTAYSDNLYDYDTFTVTVLDFQFLSTCSLVHEKQETRAGYQRIDRRDENYSIDDTSVFDKKIRKDTYKAKFGGTWVVGTDHVYNYGEKTSPLRKWRTFLDTELDYTVYGTNWYKQDNKSVTELMVPYAKQMIAAHLKIQHLVIKSRPNGLAIDIGGLKDVDLDGSGEEASPLRIISVYDQTGNLLYNGLDDDGETRKAPALTEIANGVPVNGLNALIAVYNFNHQACRDVTGLNEAVDSSSPNPKMLVGVQDNAIEASNNAVYDIYHGWESILVRSAEKVVLLLQSLIRKNKKALAELIGDGSVQTLETLRGFEKEEFAFNIELEPTQEQRVYLEQNINLAIQKGTLRSTDAYIIRQARNFKEAQFLLGMKEEQMMQQIREEKQQDIVLNAQSQEQIAVASEQARQQTIQVETQAQLMLKQADHFSKKDLLILEYQLKLKEREQMNAGTENVARIQTEGKKSVEAEKEYEKNKRDIRGKEMESKLTEQRATNAPARKFNEERAEVESVETEDDNGFESFVNQAMAGM